MKISEQNYKEKQFCFFSNVLLLFWVFLSTTPQVSAVVVVVIQQVQLPESEPVD